MKFVLVCDVTVDLMASWIKANTANARVSNGELVFDLKDYVELPAWFPEYDNITRYDHTPMAQRHLFGRANPNYQGWTYRFITGGDWYKECILEARELNKPEKVTEYEYW